MSVLYKNVSNVRFLLFRKNSNANVYEYVARSDFENKIMQLGWKNTRSIFSQKFYFYVYIVYGFKV